MVAVAVLGLAGTGAVAQGVSFSGSAGMGVVYEGPTKMTITNDEAGETDDVEVTKNESKITWDSDFDITITASGTTDGGLTFGAKTSIEADHDGGTATDSEVHIGGESWQVKIGTLDPASHKGRSINDVGYNGLGVDDVAENIKRPDPADETKMIEQGTKSQVEVSFSLGTASLAITAGQMAGTEYKVVSGDDNDEKAIKEKTEWAAGVGFDIGSTSLGIGMDSKKLMQASVSADLGAFGGKLFFSQQKVDGPIDGNETDSTDDDKQLTNKLTGIGAEISVSAGANTTINVVYAQGKQSDARKMGMVFNNDTSESDDDTASANTDKGFGVGVSHSLGGGATLQAGFAKVMKQTKASVGVTMSF